MPLDTRIPLMIQPAQMPDPIHSFGQVLSIKNLMEQSRLRDQQERENELDIRAKQMAQQDQGAGREALAESGGDPAKFLSGLAKRKVSAQFYQGVQKSIADQRHALALKSDLEIKNAQARHDMLIGGLDIVKKAPPEKRPELWSSTVGRLAQEGVLPEDMAQQFASYPGDEALPQFEAWLKSGSYLLKEREANARVGSEMALTSERNAKALNDQLGMIAATMPKAKTAADWATLRGFLSKKVDPEMLKTVVPEGYSPEAVQAVAGFGSKLSERQLAIDGLKAKGKKLTDQEEKTYLLTGQLPAAMTEYQERSLDLRERELNRREEGGNEATISNRLAKAEDEKTDALLRLEGRIDEEKRALMVKYSDYFTKTGESPTPGDQVAAAAADATLEARRAKGKEEILKSHREKVRLIESGRRGAKAETSQPAAAPAPASAPVPAPAPAAGPAVAPPAAAAPTVAPPPVSTPPTPPPAAAQAKVATKAQVDAFAKRKGVSVDEVARQLRASGWEIR